ncbi:MAG: hypothetical protein ACLTA5_01870 [Anaerococcus obesiensis]
MSELLNEKGAFEKCKQGELGFGFEIMNGINGEPPAPEEEVDAMRRKYEKLQKQRLEEMGKILGYGKEYFARIFCQ